VVPGDVEAVATGEQGHRAAADEVLGGAGARVERGAPRRQRQEADLARAAEAAAVQVAGHVERGADAVAEPEQREDVAVDARPRSRSATAARFTSFSMCTVRAELGLEDRSQAPHRPARQRLAEQLAGLAGVDVAGDADADRVHDVGVGARCALGLVDRAGHLVDGGPLGGVAGQLDAHHGPLGAGGVDHGRPQLERVEVECDAERPIGAGGVDHGAPARRAGRAPALLDHAGREQSRHHLRRGRLGDPDELADAGCASADPARAGPRVRPVVHGPQPGWRPGRGVGRHVRTGQAAGRFASTAATSCCASPGSNSAAESMTIQYGPWNTCASPLPPACSEVPLDVGRRAVGRHGLARHRGVVPAGLSRRLGGRGDADLDDSPLVWFR
jgi:hypothetical protein